MSTNLKIKIANVELEYSGSATFDEHSIKDLLSHMANLASVFPKESNNSASTNPESQIFSSSDGGNSPLNYSPNTIAAKLNASTGPDLAIAAAAYIHFVNRKESFKRQELHEAMRMAKAYSKNNMGGNLSKMIDTLVSSGRINELSNSEFSLSAAEQTALRPRLAAE